VRDEVHLTGDATRGAAFQGGHAGISETDTAEPPDLPRALAEDVTEASFGCGSCLEAVSVFIVIAEEHH
jgi:hypothetical protein